MSPRCLLVGHTAPIMCLSRASVIMEQNYIVSSSESGEMCTWDLVDGKCREAVKLSSVHTQMLPYVSAGGEDVRLFCSGYVAVSFYTSRIHFSNKFNSIQRIFILDIILKF